MVSEIIPTVPSTRTYRAKITPLNPTRTSRSYSRKRSYGYNVFHNSNRCEVPPLQSPSPATPFFWIYDPYWVDREFITVTHKHPKLHWDTASPIKQPELMRYVLFRATKRLASLTWRPCIVELNNSVILSIKAQLQIKHATIISHIKRIISHQFRSLRTTPHSIIQPQATTYTLRDSTRDSIQCNSW